MDFTAGLLALAVGLAFDWQQLFPVFGNRIAAMCALGMGSAWFLGGQVGGWFDLAEKGATSQAGASAHGLTSDVPASSGALVAGVGIGLLFLVWLLAVIPGMGFITKNVSGNAGSVLTSALIWAGCIFPPLIHLVPGRWGDLSTRLTAMGSHFGLLISGWIL